MTRLRLDQLGAAPVRPAGVADGAVVTVLRVPPECAGMRVDRFVQSQLKRTSRTRAQEIIQAGAYCPEAIRLRPGARVQAEQCILLWRAPWDDDVVDDALPELFEDDALLAIDKPPFVVVHPTARYHRSTVVKRLEASRPDLVIRLSHRLDRETRRGRVELPRNGERDQVTRVVQRTHPGGPRSHGKARGPRRALTPGILRFNRSRRSGISIRGTTPMLVWPAVPERL